MEKLPTWPATELLAIDALVGMATSKEDPRERRATAALAACREIERLQILRWAMFERTTPDAYVPGPYTPEVTLEKLTRHAREEHPFVLCFHGGSAYQVSQGWDGEAIVVGCPICDFSFRVELGPETTASLMEGPPPRDVHGAPLRDETAAIVGRLSVSVVPSVASTMVQVQVTVAGEEGVSGGDSVRLSPADAEVVGHALLACARRAKGKP